VLVKLLALVDMFLVSCPVVKPYNSNVWRRMQRKSRHWYNIIGCECEWELEVRRKGGGDCTIGMDEGGHAWMV